MVRMFKWFVPAIAVLGLVFAMSASSINAADSVPAPAGGGTVAGTVVDAAGKGVEGAMVKVMKPREKAAKGAPKADKPEKPKGAGGGAPAVGEGTTDKDGKFSIANVPAGEYSVMAGVKGTGRGMSPVSVKAGETATVTITLKAKPAK